MKYLPGMKVNYKINGGALQSIITGDDGRFMILMYLNDLLTLFIFDNDNYYYPINITSDQMTSDQDVDINMLKKQIKLLFVIAN